MNLGSLRMDLAAAAAKEAASRRIGDDYNADYWRAEAERYSDQIERLERQAEWDELADNRHG